MKKILIVIATLVILGCSTGFIVYKTVIAKSPTPGSYALANPVTTNMQGSKKVVKIDIVIDIADEKSLPFLQENNYKILDAIITVLNSKTETEYSMPNIRNTLKDELIAELSHKLSYDGITGIYFKEFVMQ